MRWRRVPPRTPLGELKRSPDSVAEFQGREKEGNRNERDRKGRKRLEGEGNGRKGKRRGREGKNGER